MLTRYRKLYPNEFIVIGADTAAGGGDYCAAQFLSKTKIDVPWVYHTPKLATEMTNDLAPLLEEIYDITKIRPVIAYERNNGGVFELDRLGTLNRNGKFKIFMMPRVGNVDVQEEIKLGWDTNTATRPAMLQQLKEAIDNHVLRIYDKSTINELFSFVTVKTSSIWKAQAEDNCNDDLVMALAIAWQLYQIEQPEVQASNQQVQSIISRIIDRGESWR
jgi:hypothetical protein